MKTVIKTTITNLRGDNERISLPLPIYEAEPRGREHLGAGVWITGIYKGPRTGRMFLRTYSIWDRGDGAHVGTRVRELDQSDFLDYCQRVDINPPVEAVEV